MGRDGEIEVGGEGWFATKEGQWGGERVMKRERSAPG